MEIDGSVANVILELSAQLEVIWYVEPLTKLISPAFKTNDAVEEKLELNDWIAHEADAEDPPPFNEDG